MVKKHYFDRQLIQNKAIAINSGGNKVHQIVKIAGKQTVIFLN